MEEEKKHLKDAEKIIGSAYMNIQELSRYLGIKASTLYKLVEEKSIPHYRIRRLIRFKKEEIDAWMEGNRQDTLDLANKRRIAVSIKKQKLNIDQIVKKAIADISRKKYITPAGKPDQVKGLGKEVAHGSL